MYISVDVAYIWCGRIAGIATVLSSLEEISFLREFSSGGRYDSRAMDVGVGDSAPRIVQMLSSAKTQTLSVALSMRFLAGLALVLASNSKILMTISFLIAAATTSLIRWRHGYGGEDGGDQMLTIMTATFAACLILAYASPVIATVGLYFIGAQACLAYVTAGIAKLASREWRRGFAVRGVLSTRSYGSRSLARIVQKSGKISLLLCWVTIAFETAFLLAPLLPQKFLIILLIVAGLFHASVAYAMGFNRFFWSFLATYPAILFLNQAVRSLL